MANKRYGPYEGYKEVLTDRGVFGIAEGEALVVGADGVKRLSPEEAAKKPRTAKPKAEAAKPAASTAKTTKS